MATRREVLVGAVATTTVAATGEAAPRPDGISDQELATLIQRTEQSEVAFLRGDFATYRSLLTHAEDYTLMQPFGGPTRRGFDTSPAHLAELSRYFKSGTGRIEVEQTYASGGLVVLVMTAHLRGVVGDLPEQPYSLRITQVYRRDGAGWRVVHRHADPLVGSITLGQLAAFARE